MQPIPHAIPPFKARYTCNFWCDFSCDFLLLMDVNEWISHECSDEGARSQKEKIAGVNGPLHYSQLLPSSFATTQFLFLYVLYSFIRMLQMVRQPRHFLVPRLQRRRARRPLYIRICNLWILVCMVSTYYKSSDLG